MEFIYGFKLFRLVVLCMLLVIFNYYVLILLSNCVGVHTVLSKSLYHVVIDYDVIIKLSLKLLKLKMSVNPNDCIKHLRTNTVSHFSFGHL